MDKTGNGLRYTLRKGTSHIIQNYVVVVALGQSDLGQADLVGERE